MSRLTRHQKLLLRKKNGRVEARPIQTPPKKTPPPDVPPDTLPPVEVEEVEEEEEEEVLEADADEQEPGRYCGACGIVAKGRERKCKSCGTLNSWERIE